MLDRVFDRFLDCDRDGKMTRSSTQTASCSATVDPLHGLSRTTRAVATSKTMLIPAARCLARRRNEAAAAEKVVYVGGAVRRELNVGGATAGRTKDGIILDMFGKMLDRDGKILTLDGDVLGRMLDCELLSGMIPDGNVFGVAYGSSTTASCSA
ncbi:hypothetical protein M885DRAFT_569967 [Pelagophyceae sp. CCMP2097]|nr:hypothetical protein M885DRAFT_569967 [Pelagophyceae sp. CCMP2097]